jgi:uncharacterized cupredoxin-like copper-binding protein
MTRAHHQIAVIGGLALALGLGLGGIAVAWASGPIHTVDRAPITVEIGIRYSHFDRSQLIVPVRATITFLLHNDDPIDHEWIVGDAAVHEHHRDGTEPEHGTRPTEVTVPAGTSRATTITFATPGTYRYICHLPGHETYGMVGTLVVSGD